MSWITERMMLNADGRYLQGIGEDAVSAFDAKVGASLVLPADTSFVAVQLGAFATVGLAIDAGLAPTGYVGGGLSASFGLALPSSFGVTVSGEVLTRGVRFSALANIPIPVGWAQGISPHIGAGYVFEHQTNFKSGTQGESVHGFVISAGFDMLPAVLR